jgi:glyoxylase-like metal-dependent hydrolase (beta-lactamase superfamily II)
MYRHPVGQIQLTTLDDGSFPFPAHFFFSNVPEQTWRACLAVDEEGKIPVGHNTALLEDGQRAIVVDTGYGDDTHEGRTGHMLEELERTGRRREDIDTVVLTHGHGDHIKGGVMENRARQGEREPAFPNARYLLARSDYDWFSGPGRVPEFNERIVPLERRGNLELFDGERRLTPAISLLPTPGHSPGHTNVLIESEGCSALFLGDVCHHPLHFSHPNWVSRFDTDPELTPKTRAWLFALALERNALLVCPHALAPGLGRLRRDQHGYAWQALD